MDGAGGTVNEKRPQSQLCAEFRRLNAFMKLDILHMPLFEEIFYEIKENKIFTTIDFIQGYWLIKIDEFFKEKNTFVSRYWNF